MKPNDLLDLARRAARGGGELLLDRFSGRASGVGSKSTPTDLVSDADLAADEYLQSFIAAERPGDGFITEESEGRDSSTGLTWVLDPLDATVNYLFRIPWWCVSVAVEDAEGGLAGAVYNPNLDEMFTGVRGGGAFLNDRAIQVSDRSEFPRALIGTGFAYDADVRVEQAQVVARLLPQARDIRRFGSAALDLCAVACGRLDGYFETGTAHWDTAAGSLIVREAGGTITDLRSSDDPKGLVVASNGLVHETLVTLVAER